MVTATHILKIVIQVVDQATPKMNTVATATNKIEKNVGNINKRMNTFDMRLLSVMFGGMALARAFSGINKSIINTFIKAEDTTSGLARATTRLSASWEFLKFSIMDALNADWFITFIDGLIRVINWFGQLKAGWKVTFLAVTGGLALIGTGLMIIAQFKLFWDAVFGMGGFLRSTNTMHAKTLGSKGVFTAMRKFAIAGLAIKMALDLKDFLSGEISLKELISTLGLELALLGAVSGKPWVIAIGVAFKLIPFAEQITGFGKGLISGAGASLKDLFLNPPGAEAGFDQAGEDMKRVVGDLGRSFMGFAITGVGTVLENMGNFLEVVDDSTTSTETLSTTMIDELVPATEDVIDVLDGKEQSVVNALEKTGTEMDTISGEKTDGFIAASDDRITQLDDEISKYEEAITKQKEFLAGFGSSLNALTGRSPVSDED